MDEAEPRIAKHIFVITVFLDAIGINTNLNCYLFFVCEQ